MKPFELHEIVLVRHEGYEHYGEVLSRPTPNKTLLVRMVPGHSGTLREIPIERLFPILNAPPKYVHIAEVSGTGSFPLDMLRRENAAPVQFNPEEPIAPGKRLLIGKADRRREASWNFPRWESFGWHIQSLSSVLYKVERE